MKSVVMPQFGESQVEPVIIRDWTVRPGTRVTPGQVLAHVETDKSTMEIEATAAGVVARIIVDAGCSALPGTRIAEIEEVA